MKNNIVLTGGHAGTTAIALVEELLESKHIKDKYDLYWIGAKTSVEGKQVEPIETKVLIDMGVKVKKITAGKLQRKFTIWTLPSLFKIPVGFWSASRVLNKLKPKLVISFGGYTALPVVFASKLLGIKVLIHEQTMSAGRTNIITSRFATKIALARSESIEHFQKDKTIVTGNPIMKNIRQVKAKTSIKTKKPVLFITLGSRGSQRINNAVFEILPQLLKNYKVVHLTGQLDFEKFTKLKSGLSHEIRNDYEIHSRVEPLEIGSLYEKSDMILARAGANTVSEIIYLKIPSLLIPLPVTYLNEQLRNANYARDFGVASVLEEKDMSSDKLLSAINSIRDNWDEIKKSCEDKESPDLNAVVNLAKVVTDLL